MEAEAINSSFDRVGTEVAVAESCMDAVVEVLTKETMDSAGNSLPCARSHLRDRAKYYRRVHKADEVHGFHAFIRGLMNDLYNLSISVEIVMKCGLNPAIHFGVDSSKSKATAAASKAVGSPPANTSSRANKFQKWKNANRGRAQGQSAGGDSKPKPGTTTGESEKDKGTISPTRGRLSLARVVMTKPRRPR